MKNKTPLILPQASSESFLKRPRKPTQPWLGNPPSEYLPVVHRIDLYQGMTLAELIADLPAGVEFRDLTFDHTDDYNGYDTGVRSLSYQVSERNPHYDLQLREYEIKKQEYEARLVIYQAEKKIYDRWHLLTDTEKLDLENQRKALLKAEKIKKLETQLANLRNT